MTNISGNSSVGSPDQVDLDAWAAVASCEDALAALYDEACRSYCVLFPDAEPYTFTFGGSEFWYDTFDDANGHESRPIAGWTRVPQSVLARDRRRQRRFPLAPDLVARGFERGHLIARGSGGPLDVNLFPQAWQVNQGHGPEGVEFRRLESLAAAHPGALQMTRLLWADQSNVPAGVHVIVAVPGGRVELGVFGNVPIARRPGRGKRPTELLRAGVAFHRRVQSEFVAGLVGADAKPEKVVRLLDGRNGRIDLLVVPVGPERMAVIVEIKNSNWDVFKTHRIRPNIRVHLRQLQNYVDEAVDQIGKPDGWDSVVGVLLYPHRPADADVLATIIEIADREAITVVWYADTEWGSVGQ